MTAMPIYGPEVQRKPAAHHLPMSLTLVTHLRAADPEYQAVQRNGADAVLGPCKDCARPMVMQAPYKRVSRWRDQGYVRASGHGMCNGCYSRAYRWGTLPNPAPRQQLGRRIHALVPYDVLGKLLTFVSTEVEEWTRSRLGDAVVTRAIEAVDLDQAGGGQP